MHETPRRYRHRERSRLSPSDVLTAASRVEPTENGHTTEDYTAYTEGVLLNVIMAPSMLMNRADRYPEVIAQHAESNSVLWALRSQLRQGGQGARVEG